MSQSATNRAPHKNAPPSASPGIPPARGWRTQLRFLADFAKQHFWKGVVGLAGIAGFLFTPVKDWAYHTLWHEHAVLQCHMVQQEVSVNDDFELDLTVVPQGIAISPGFIEVDYPADKLVLVKPTGLLETQSIADTKIAAQLMFRALAHGPAPVEIHFSTRYGKYTVSQPVLVREIDANHRPSKENFTGTWLLRLGNANGELHLEDDNGKIAGHYELDNGDIGEINGLRQTAAFLVSLTNKRGEKFTVNSSLMLSDTFLELKGYFFDPRTPTERKDFNGSFRL